MPFRIRLQRDLDQEVRRIAAEQVDRAIIQLATPSEGVHAVVHEVRKRGKETRGLLRLVRDADPRVFSRANATLRDLARRLSALRDVGAQTEAIDNAQTHADGDEREALGRLRRHAQAGPDAAAVPAATGLLLAGVATELAAFRGRVDDWPLRGLRRVHLAQGITRTFARGRDALRRVDGPLDSAGLHELRKRTKYLWYQHRLLRSLWRGPMDAVAAQLEVLGDRLGEHHDLDILQRALSAFPLEGADGAMRVTLERWLERRRTSLYDEIRHGARRVYAERARHFSRRIRAYFDATGP
jgi:CHAD domain-containing protein